mmetsp:Transcript_44642/g.123730  ORF Transcript_44642/g.123730 Transcript_44642/m.123730 type:complete len:243 (+) Transcript_44642:116-844(+)
MCGTARTPVSPNKLTRSRPWLQLARGQPGTSGTCHGAPTRAARNLGGKSGRMATLRNLKPAAPSRPSTLFRAAHPLGTEAARAPRPPRREARRHSAPARRRHRGRRRTRLALAKAPARRAAPQIASPAGAPVRGCAPWASTMKALQGPSSVKERAPRTAEPERSPTNLSLLASSETSPDAETEGVPQFLHDRGHRPMFATCATTPGYHRRRAAGAVTLKPTCRSRATWCSTRCQGPGADDDL